MQNSAIPILLTSASSGTLQALNTLDDFTDNPDLVDDYFELVKRYIQNIPGQYITLPYNHLIFQKVTVVNSTLKSVVQPSHCPVRLVE